MNRRLLLRASALVSVAAALAGCAKNPLNTTITVNLANGQAEAKTILSALQAVYTDVSATLSAAIQSQVSTYLSDLDAAVTAFVDLPSGSASVASFAQNVLSDVQPLVSLLPLAPVTKTAINTGLLLISGLISGLSSISVAAPATANIGASNVRVIPGPVPVPLG